MMKDIEHLNSGKILLPGLPFSEAVRVGKTLYLSGQHGILPSTTKLAEGLAFSAQVEVECIAVKQTADLSSQ